MRETLCEHDAVLTQLCAPLLIVANNTVLKACFLLNALSVALKPPDSTCYQWNLFRTCLYVTRDGQHPVVEHQRDWRRFNITVEYGLAHLSAVKA